MEKMKNLVVLFVLVIAAGIVLTTRVMPTGDEHISNPPQDAAAILVTEVPTEEIDLIDNPNLKALIKFGPDTSDFKQWDIQIVYEPTGEVVKVIEMPGAQGYAENAPKVGSFIFLSTPYMDDTSKPNLFYIEAPEFTPQLLTDEALDWQVQFSPSRQQLAIWISRPQYATKKSELIIIDSIGKVSYFYDEPVFDHWRIGWNSTGRFIFVAGITDAPNQAPELPTSSQVWMIDSATGARVDSWNELPDVKFLDHPVTVYVTDWLNRHLGGIQMKYSYPMYFSFCFEDGTCTPAITDTNGMNFHLLSELEEF